MTLPAFAAERLRRANQLPIDICCRRRRSAANRRTPLLLSIDRTDRRTNGRTEGRTDTRPLRRLCSAYYPGNVNNRRQIAGLHKRFLQSVSTTRKGKGVIPHECVGGVLISLPKAASQWIDKPLQSVTHGQYAMRMPDLPTVTFPAAGNHRPLKGKDSPYSITERRVPELIPVLGSQPAGVVSRKPGGRLPLLSARPAVTPATLKRTATNFAAW